MKAFVVAFLGSIALVSALQASPTLERARQLERSGDAVGARAMLAKAAQDAPEDVTALAEYAEFLDNFDDPQCRQAYGKLLTLLGKSGDRATRQAVARRLVMLDLLAGDRAAASRDGEAYRAAGGRLELPLAAGNPAGDTKAYIQIPGPLRSFARMAAVSTDNAMDDMMAALARNVVTNGYEASHSNEALEQTEYLKLVHRYLSQARELDKLAGEDKVLKIPSCDSPNVADIIRVLGFRMRGGCGSEVVLETVNAARAFLTTDSGFPVDKLEEALRTNRPFSYDYHPTQVPVLFGAAYWTAGSKDADFLTSFIGDPANCRLYLGFSKLDNETANSLRNQATYTHLKAYAHVLDFFGAMFEIRDGKAIVPGGQRSAAVWTDLVGVSPDKGAEFLDKLMIKDDGWLCSLYDALARIHGPVKDYLT